MPRPPLVTLPPLWMRRTLFVLAGAVAVAGAAGIPAVGASAGRGPTAAPAAAAGGAGAGPTGTVGTLPLPTAPAAAATPAAAPAPSGRGCPSGSLRWDLSTFTATIDPLDHRQVSVTMAGTVTDDGSGPATVEAATEVLSTARVAGSAVYPVYLVLGSATLAPGATSRWQGQSPEVGLTPSQISRGHLAVAASWATAPRCPPPGHAGLS